MADIKRNYYLFIRNINQQLSKITGSFKPYKGVHDGPLFNNRSELSYWSRNCT